MSEKQREEKKKKEEEGGRRCMNGEIVEWVVANV